MNQLQIFNFSNHDVRVITKDGQPWWIAKDVCEVLDLTNPTVAIQRLDHDEVTKFNLGGLTGETNIVNEPGLYSLILGSRKPEAKQFKRWITHEVLPTIRKHGMYATDELLNNPDFLIAAGQKIKEEQEARRRLEEKIEQDKPLVLFAESIQTSDNSILIGNFAKILKQNGVEIGQNRLFEWMRNNGYLGKSGSNRNVPTQRSMEMKLFEITERTVHHPGHDPKVTITTKLTGKGQIYFLNKFLKQTA